MLDDIRSDDGLSADDKKQRARRVDSGKAGFADREVPLDQGGERVFAAAVHAWLDGELPEAAVRKGETSRDVEFWNRLTDEAERRRRLRTPAHVEAQIMAALPQTAPQVITPWYRREFVVTPGSALAAAAALIAIAAVATAAVLSLVG